MAKTIVKDPKLLDDLKKDPTDVLFTQSDAAIAQIGVQDDPLIYKIAVSALGTFIILVICGLVYIDSQQNLEAPESLVALASAAVGALAGLLAPSGAH